HHKLKVVHQPEIARIITEKLRLNALGPNLVRAADVDEHAAIALVVVAFRGPPPLNLEHVVAVLLLGDQVAVRYAFADDHAILDEENRLRIDLALGLEKYLPAGQVLAVEQLDGPLLLRGGGGGQHERGEQGNDHNLSSQHDAAPS